MPDANPTTTTTDAQDNDYLAQALDYFKKAGDIYTSFAGGTNTPPTTTTAPVVPAKAPMDYKPYIIGGGVLVGLIVLVSVFKGKG